MTVSLKSSPANADDVILILAVKLRLLQLLEKLSISEGNGLSIWRLLFLIAPTIAGGLSCDIDCRKLFDSSLDYGLVSCISTLLSLPYWSREQGRVMRSFFQLHSTPSFPPNEVESTFLKSLLTVTLTETEPHSSSLDEILKSPTAFVGFWRSYIDLVLIVTNNTYALD
jgi:hypothetical protein